MKTCFKCGRALPLGEFYRHPMMADGRLGKCKECTKRDVASNRRLNRDAYREYERRRYARRKGTPLYRANTITSNAIRDGRLVRQPCEACGSTRAQAHHDNYKKPLDVRWLCLKHHTQHHSEARANG